MVVFRELKEISWLNCLLLYIVMKVYLCFLPCRFHMFGVTVPLKMWFWKFSCFPTQQMHCSYQPGQFHGIRILAIWRRYLNIMSKNLLISFKIIDLPIMMNSILWAPKCQKQTSLRSVFIRFQTPKMIMFLLEWFSDIHHRTIMKSIQISHSARTYARIWCTYPHHSHLLTISKFQKFQACFLKHLSNEKTLVV